jgi:hypothetical protein
MIETVRMKREVPMFKGGPVTAAVHPDDVESWKLHDWVVDDEGHAVEAQEGEGEFSLANCTVKHLKELAKERGVTLSRGVNTKDEIIAELEKAGV